MRYAQLKLGLGFHPVRAALYYGHRLITRPRVRNVVSNVIAATLRVANRSSRVNTDSTQDNSQLRYLREHGFTILGDVLSPTDVADICNFLRDKHAVAGQQSFRADEPPPGTTLADYPVRTVLDCPHILEVANDPAILRIASAYLRCKPTISQIAMRWSFPVQGQGAYTQQFHRDYDDWRFIKLFVYLTDVDLTSGPHVFVAGSHRTAGRLRALCYNPDMIEREYGSTRVQSITGPRGMGFMADTYGIHKGQAPETRARLFLQVQYSILPVFAFQYQPVAHTRVSSVDPYINRLLIV